MFKEILPILAQRGVHIEATMQGDQINLIVHPVVSLAEAKAGKTGLATPLNLKGSAAELDTELPAILTRYAERHVSLAASLDASLELMAAADKEAAQQATKKLQAAIKNAASAVVKPGTPAVEDDSDAEEAECCTPSAPKRPVQTGEMPREADLWD